MPNQVPYGLWPSPFTPTRLADAIRFGGIAWDSDGKRLVWLERRGGKGVLCCDDGSGDAPRDLTGDLSVRARVGYGGGDFGVCRGQAFFVSGGRLYRQDLVTGPAEPITPKSGDLASPTVSPDGRWVVYVHTDGESDCLAIVDAEGRHWPQRLTAGCDFYMQPRWHPDGTRLAWVSWRYPNMPWDGATLTWARIQRGERGLPFCVGEEEIAGGSEIAVFQPEFSPDGRYLSYVSDQSGWDGLYLYELATGTHRPLVVENAELGVPAWAQDLRTHAWSRDGRSIYYCRSQEGRVGVWRVDVGSGDRRPVEALDEYSDFSHVTGSPGQSIAMIASGPHVPSHIVTCDPRTGRSRVVARSAREDLAPREFSVPRPITWASPEGVPVHGLLYPPAERGYESGGKPPMVVRVHGGPTGQRTMAYSPEVQFLTSRGYAVLEVNYRGSTGYGREYRNLLRGNWGLVDVEDAVNGARHIVEQGWADGSRMAIMGGSAGGYTVLQTLVTHPGMFKAGVCLYGVVDLFGLARDTHKFERHYTDSLVGPLPEASQAYRERSPVFSADRIRDPVAVFQGEKDRVVPKEQAESIVAALIAAGVPHIYRVFAGEGHGWRLPETISQYLTSLESFLQDYLVFR